MKKFLDTNNIVESEANASCTQRELNITSILLNSYGLQKIGSQNSVFCQIILKRQISSFGFVTSRINHIFAVFEKMRIWKFFLILRRGSQL